MSSTHRHRHRNHLPRWLAVAAAVPLLVLWSRAQYADIARLAKWNASRAADLSGFLATQTAKSVPADSQAIMDTAYYLGEKPFPPRYEDAQALVARGLRISPLRSIFWLYGARYRMFEGRPEEARAALERSDVLHPLHVTRRLMAVELWDLLGERERAIGLARQVAAVNARTRAMAAGSLVAIGVSPAEVLAMLAGEGTTPDEMGALLEAVRVEDAASMRAAWAGIDKGHLRSAEFRTLAARILSKPLLFDELIALWQAGEDSPLVSLPRGAGTPSVYLSNPLLTRSPLGEHFHLGWQPIPRRRSADFFWIGHGGTGSGAPVPQLRLTFKPLPRKEQETFRWAFYRTPVAARDHALEVLLWVRTEPPGTSRVHLVARLGADTVLGPKALPSDLEWRAVRVVLPPTDDDRILELSLLRAWPEGNPETARLFIRGLDIVKSGDERGS